MQDSYDIAIIGAGPAGLCFARAISKLGLSVLMIEKQPLAAIKNPAVDGRDIALTHFSKKALGELGIWDKIPETEVSQIKEAKVFDGDADNCMRLSSSEAETLGFIVSNHFIRAAAFAAVEGDKNITLLDSTGVEQMELADSSAKLSLSNGRSVSCKLVIAADSRFSEARRKAGISASTNEFGKTMLLCQMQHENSHNGTAHECFHHGHTLAVLPLVGNRSSVIITLKPLDAERMMKMPDEELSGWVEEKFHHRLGKMKLDSKRHAFPLVGVYADRFVAKRLALLGDAAVGMHPVTAHGFNFGLKGAITLSELIKTAIRTGGDIASPILLESYQRSHRLATKPLYLTTSGIVSLYTNDSEIAKIVRKYLLKTANRVQPVKSMLVSKLTEKGSEGINLKAISPLRIARHLLKAAG